MRLAAFLLLAACGGSAARPTPPTPARSPAVIELAGKADTVCACADGECAADRFAELLEREAELMSPAEQAGLDGEHDRAVECFVTKSGRPRGLEFVAYFSGVVDKICACADAACVKAVMEPFAGEAAKHDDAVFSAREQRLMGEKGHQASECLKRFAGEAVVSPAVEVTERIAERICACPSSDCAIEAAQAGKAELDALGVAGGSEDDQRRIQAAGQKAADCMDALRGR